MNVNVLPSKHKVSLILYYSKHFVRCSLIARSSIFAAVLSAATKCRAVFLSIVLMAKGERSSTVLTLEGIRGEGRCQIDLPPP